MPKYYKQKLVDALTTKVLKNQLHQINKTFIIVFFIFFIFYLFSTRPSPGLLPVLGPLGSGTDATHQPGPALRLLGY